jgi:hypothetical protein
MTALSVVSGKTDPRTASLKPCAASDANREWSLGGAAICGLDYRVGPT